MTREELTNALVELRDRAASVDTDAAAVLAVLARMMSAGEDLSLLTECALDVERRSGDRHGRERR